MESEGRWRENKKGFQVYEGEEALDPLKPMQQVDLINTLRESCRVREFSWVVVCFFTPWSPSGRVLVVRCEFQGLRAGAC